MARTALAAIFTTFTTISTAIGETVFCMPINHPLNVNNARVAGAAHILIKKYCLESASSSGVQSITINAASTKNHCIAIRKSAETKAVASPFTRYFMASDRSLLPYACAVRPPVPTRRNPKFQ